MRIVYNNRYGCIRICDKSKKKHVVGGLLGGESTYDPCNCSEKCWVRPGSGPLASGCTAIDTGLTTAQKKAQCQSFGGQWCPTVNY